MLPCSQLSSGRVGLGAILAAMRRPFVALAVVLVAIGAFTGGLAWLLDTPRPPAGAPKAEHLYLGLCATCHGPDGKGSWRAALFLVRPGNLSNATTMDARPDQYLFDLIKHGGAPIGRPGMPAFGSTLTDDDIREIVRYVRGLSHAR
jgi:mono/diheme cytochrome c family protein